MMGTTEERGPNQRTVDRRIEKSASSTKSCPQELYGGGEPNIFKETSVKLERDGYSCTAVVLLQKNSPHDLLISTTQ